ncbi:hypothetical protein FG386_000235 [Cryptosporidium ryanae]|uniref:uncharacterized protein n=1 Tax=Cryptosporidium ryanae TaxID=515981 RepID=UPI003519E2D9|nr:hypothetical protein FG386_000235 [Cryptosporidium ryanae]
MEIFEIFIIRYINYINIWSIELNNDNFYEEFRDGILLSSLLRKWSSLYGYNTEGELIIYKRPLNKNQALNNISLCLNFLSNPPEKSNLPELNTSDMKKELINVEDIYEKNEFKIINFLCKIFHHYFIPYLRLNSRNLLLNVNKYLQCHGLSFSDETINEFYKMIPNNNKYTSILSDRIESWERYLSYNLSDLNNNDKYSSKYVNSLQCDLTSNGFVLIMVMLYHMGWIDVSILCQLYYNPKKLEEYKWNHEILYYSFQTIINYLNIQKELLIVNNTGKIKLNKDRLKKNNYNDENTDNIKYEDDNDEYDEYYTNHNTVMTSSIISTEIPFILIPLSSLYLENFSPYILLLQLDVIYNLLTQQIDNNYDYCYGEGNKVPVYGPYQPISLELLDELTYKDNYPINWTNINIKDSITLNKNKLSIYNNFIKRENNYTDKYQEEEEEEEEEVNDNNCNYEQKYQENNDEVLLEDYVKNIYNRETHNNEAEEEEFDNDYNDKIEENNNLLNTSVGNNTGVQTNINNNNNSESYYIELNNKLLNDMNEGRDEMNDLFTGLEKELELLKIHENTGSINANNNNNNNNNNSNTYSKDLKDSNNLLEENENTRHINKLKMFRDLMISNSNNIKQKFPVLSDNEKVKPLISRSALEEQKKKLEERSLNTNDNDDSYTSKVLDITRKPNGVMDKISSAINENNKLLERLKSSLNKNINEKKNDTKEIASTEDNKENRVNISNNETDGHINNKNNSVLNKSNDKSKKSGSNRSKCLKTLSIPKNKVSFSDRVKMEVEKALVNNKSDI